MIRRLATLAVLPLALTACSSFDERYQAALPVEQRLPIEVTTQIAAVDVETDSRGRLTGRSQGEIGRLLNDYKRDGTGTLEIQVARGHSASPVAESQIRDMASLYGIPRDRIVLRSYAGDGAPMRVAYASYVASVPACETDNWNENLHMTWDNSTYASFGCATQMNTAAMAADPRDLLEAKPMDAAAAARRQVVMGKYQKGESPSSARTEGDSGKVAQTASGTERK